MAPNAVSWPLESNNALLPTPLSCHEYANTQSFCSIHVTIDFMKLVTSSVVYLGCGVSRSRVDIANKGK
jgi:hypothetical protein